MDNTIASIWLRKYARIFVLGHYLFLEAHSFPRASLSENCSLLGTDNVRGQISEYNFAPNEGYCLYIIKVHHEIDNKVVNTIFSDFARSSWVTLIFPISLQYWKFHENDKKVADSPGS